MRISTLIILAGVVTCSARPAAAADVSPEPPVDVSCRRDSGTGPLTATGGPKETVVSIASPGAAGNATITFKVATPSRLKFRYARLGNLTSFTLADGKHTFQGRLACVMAWSSAHWDANGRPVKDPALAAVTMNMKWTSPRQVEVSVTTRGAEVGRELKVAWLQN